jgi:hypothetical protein
MSRTFFSQLLNVVFALAICVGYLSLALGLLGYINLGKASLATLVASIVACVAVGVFFLMSYDRLRRRSTD